VAGAARLRAFEAGPPVALVTTWPGCIAAGAERIVPSRTVSPPARSIAPE
jgi:hypothetical protein